MNDIMRKFVYVYANKKDADQSVHPRSLISTFVIRCLDSLIPLVSISKISSPNVASVAAEAGLSLNLSETPKTGFLVTWLKCTVLKPTSFHEWFEPWHDKTNKVTVPLAKTQISPGSRPVWSESSLSAWRNLGSLATHWVHSKDSDQTGWMPRLIWVFAGHTLILLLFLCHGSLIFKIFTGRYFRENKLPWKLNISITVNEKSERNMKINRH